jgi:cytochrome c-type biogenesis protein CcmE
MNRQFKFVAGIAVIISTVAFLVYTAVDQTKMYMITVSEFVTGGNAYAGTTLRIAGRVQEDSMIWDASKNDLRFAINDIEGEGQINIHFTGILPDMFSEGRDVVVEGPYAAGDMFEATAVLTSCPSKYEAEVEGETAEP